MQTTRFELTHDDVEHLLTVASGGDRTYVWTRDGVEVATRRGMDDRLTLAAENLERDGDGERLEVRAGLRGVKRATLVTGDDEVDLVPAPGSWAARREERIRRHPRRHVTIQVLLAVGRVVVPLLFAGVVFGWLPDLDLPGLALPAVDLPDVPVPSVDLPDIPWPDWELGWLAWVLDHLKAMVAVVLAAVVAQHEVRRRREQDARRRRRDTSRPEQDER